MEPSTESLGALRLLQITDSSFPVGGYAYSHGLEWLVSERRVTNAAELAIVLRSFISQTVGRQWLPAAALAHRSRTPATLIRADHALDASISASAEREAGRAMGARLLEVATASFPAAKAARFREAVRTGESPGQYATSFGALASDFGVSETAALVALAYSMTNSITQAAIRLGIVGADAAARLIAEVAPALESAVDDVSGEHRLRIGSFSPLLEMASLLQPTLKFRMFAS